jgi:hypothetical protein
MGPRLRQPVRGRIASLREGETVFGFVRKSR